MTACAVEVEIGVYDNPPIRVLVETFAEADRLWARWTRTRYAVGKPLGGAIFSGLVRCAICQTRIRLADAVLLRDGRDEAYCTRACADRAVAAHTNVLPFHSRVLTQVSGK